VGTSRALSSENAIRIRKKDSRKAPRLGAVEININEVTASLAEKNAYVGGVVSEVAIEFVV
jgi:hypothetical protein